MLSSACGAPQVAMPDDLPPLVAPWSHLGSQIPQSADAVLFVSLDEATRADLGRLLEAPDTVSGVSDVLTDVLGIDISQSDAFDRLGLQLGGGAAFFLEAGRWVVLADLVDDEPIRLVMDELEARNPHLSMFWRRVEGEDVLSIRVSDDIESEPELHIVVSGRQVVVLFDTNSVVDSAAIDKTLVAVLEADWDETVYFNPRFAEAVTRFGGGTWALLFANTAPVLDSIPPSASNGLADALNVSPPSGSRCQEVQDQIGQVIRYTLGAVDRSLEPSAEQLGSEQTTNRPIEREVQRFVLQIGPSHTESVGRMLQPSPIDRVAFEGTSLASFFVHLDRHSLTTELGAYADTLGCNNAAALVGLLGEAGSLLGDSSDIATQLDGFLGLSLFDLRNTGGVPFADLFVLMGSEEPAALAQSLRAVLESELDLYGSPEVVAGFQSVSYRFALLYRLGLFEGLGALGVSVGRVDESYLTATLIPPSDPEPAFFGLTLDGERMATVYDTIIEIGLTGLDDETLVQSQRELFESSLADLRRLRHLRVTGRYVDDAIVFEIEQESAQE